MIHGSTSFNFCRSTNVEHCWTVYHSNFKNKASWKRQGNTQLMKKRNNGDSRQHGKLSPDIARIYSLIVPSFAAISYRALSLVSRFLWSFDLTSYRHGKVLYRLISWLVLPKLQSNSAVSNSSVATIQCRTLALARSPRRVWKVSGECKFSITHPFGECNFRHQEII